LTKLYEETLRGSLSELCVELNERPSLKGEYVLVVGGSSADLSDSSSDS